jgi:hypothetical protein
MYMDDVMEILNEIPGIEVSLYTDDLAICLQDTDKWYWPHRCRPLLTRCPLVARDVEISLTKTEYLFISMDLSENSGKFNPHLIVYDRPVVAACNPIFLGVTLDRQLGFSKHARKVQKKIVGRTSQLRRLRGLDWGNRFDLLLSTQGLHRPSCPVQCVGLGGIWLRVDRGSGAGEAERRAPNCDGVPREHQ